MKSALTRIEQLERMKPRNKIVFAMIEDTENGKYKIFALIWDGIAGSGRDGRGRIEEITNTRQEANSRIAELAAKYPGNYTLLDATRILD